MAWKKIVSGRKQKRYKRFSSAIVKVKSKGPTLNGVFPGSRTIPLDSHAVFEYRKRGSPSIEQVENREWLYKVFNIDGAADPIRYDPDMLRAKGELKDRQDALNKATVLDHLSQLEHVWCGEYRTQKLHTWNCIVLRAGRKLWTKFMFEGNKYVFLRKAMGGQYLRSIVYTDREKAMRDYEFETIVWKEVFRFPSGDSDSELACGPPQPRPMPG